MPKLDPEFEEVTEGEEIERKEMLKTKWAALEALVGTEKRINLVASDLVAHFENRLMALEGKAMIVCMSRRICVLMYDAITKLRPEWHDEDDKQGAIKVVMTGSASDPLGWQVHIRNKQRREDMARRFKDPSDPLKIVIVRDKPGGLIVDYIGLAYRLQMALKNYTESGGTGKTAIDQEDAVAVMLEKYEICCNLFHGFDWSLWTRGTSAQKLSLLPSAQEHILRQEDGKSRLLKAVTELSIAFALSVPHDSALKIRDDVGFFQAVRSALAKSSIGGHKPPDELDFAIQQLVSKAVTPGGVVDIFAEAGLKKPDISILSDEMLEKSVRAYQTRSIEAAQVIEELIELAREMREAHRRGEILGLTDDELAFYDALEGNSSAVKILGDDVLKQIARELVLAVRRNVTIDWSVKESSRARLRVIVRRLLRKHGYPPDRQEKATQTVLEQAELLCKDWTNYGQEALGIS
jgi:type I restriction enzyme R subunit